MVPDIDPEEVLSLAFVKLSAARREVARAREARLDAEKQAEWKRGEEARASANYDEARAIFDFIEKHPEVVAPHLRLEGKEIRLSLRDLMSDGRLKTSAIRSMSFVLGRRALVTSPPEHPTDSPKVDGE